MRVGELSKIPYKGVVEQGAALEEGWGQGAGIPLQTMKDS